MDLLVMEYAVRVAEYGNFSQAALACHVGQPALSQQIAKLERELDVKLFERNSRGARVTQAGEVFVSRARQILSLSNTLREEMSRFADLEQGTITVGGITSLECIGFSKIMSGFLSAHPMIRLDLRQEGSEILSRQVLDRAVDLAFINLPGSVHPSLQFEKLGEDAYVVALRADHPFAKKTNLSLNELASEHFIFQQPSQTASALLLDACRKAGFDPFIVCRSAEPSMTFSLVRAGMGIAFVPMEETQKETEDIVCLPLEKPILKEVGMLWRKDAASPILQALIEYARDFCHSSLR